jgi:Flp pilus assembly protein TadD
MMRLRGLATAAAMVLLALASQMVAAVETDAADAVAADPDVAAARAAHGRRDWKASAAHLQRAERRVPDDADLQNSLGHALRQLGDFDAAFRHYRKALALDPRHRGAHEYIGEAYLLVGDLAAAQRHLELLRAICVLPCEELRDLEQAIAAHAAKAR